MTKNPLEQFKQAASELRNFFDSQEHRLDKPEKAFIKWYTKARFGKSAEIQFLDGAQDGGIDAIVTTNDGSFILQSKYETVPRVSPIPRKDIADFENIAAKFKSDNNDTEFNNWLLKVKPSIKPIYKKIRAKKNIRFIFITTKRFLLETSDLIEVEDIQHISALWYLYQEGFTPPTESIEIRLQTALTTEEDGFTTCVGLADVRDFLNLMENDKNERLFAQNVRTDLRSPINKEIRKTYEEEANKFWLGNNGIYVVCNAITATGSTYKLTYPAIINGSQTLHALYASTKRHECKILVRIVKMDVLGDPKLLSSVIRQTNTQNPMKLVNLSAHDPFQLNIARYLDRFKIFYERREKEWVNEKKSMLVDYFPVNIKYLTQWLSTLHQDIGLGRARARVSDLFQIKFYNEIFSDFDTWFKSSSYKKLEEIIWAGLFVQKMIRYLSKYDQKLAWAGQLALIRITYEAIENSNELSSKIVNLLSNHQFYKKDGSHEVRKIYKYYLSTFLKLQKSVEKKEPNIDFNNFFKRDDLTAMAYSKINSNISINKLSKALTKYLNKFE